MNIRELQKECHRIAKEKGFWDEGERNLGELLMLIVSELGEALEALRNQNRQKSIEHYDLTDYPCKEGETWKEIKEYPDYMVSNFGRVKSLDMKVWNGKTYHTKEGKILSPGLSCQNYYTVSLRGKTKKVSRLVAKSFIKNPYNFKYVNHKDGDKTNDKVDNLEWCTPSYNEQHAYKNGLKKKGNEHPNSILTIEDKYEIVARRKSGEKFVDIVKDYEVTLSCIKNTYYKIQKQLNSFEVELADAIIRIMDLAESEGIDLEWQIKKKMEYNKTRPRKHGKEF